MHRRSLDCFVFRARLNSSLGQVREKRERTFGRERAKGSVRARSSAARPRGGELDYVSIWPGAAAELELQARGESYGRTVVVKMKMCLAVRCFVDVAIGL